MAKRTTKKPAKKRTVKKASKKSESGSLTLYILLSIVLAIVAAVAAPEFAKRLHVGGEIFLRLLKMMVVPLVVTSVMSGILGMGDVRKLGKPGGYAVLYYLSTTLVAVLIGLAIVNVIRPGVGTVDQTTLDEVRASGEVSKLQVEKGVSGKTPSIGDIIHNLVLMMFTDNLFSSAVNTNLLPLIFFSIIFAGMLTTMGTRVATLTTLIEQVNEALMHFVLLLMRVAPIGIFCLVAARFGEAKADGTLLKVLGQTGWYVLTVIVGLGVHSMVVLPILYWFFTKKNPFTFMLNMSQALMTAFSTASSSATLPVTMECANLKGGVSKQSTEFVLPLGATINMDGTALYEAAAAIFIAQAIGMDLTIVQQMTVALTATLAAVGAAGIPEAGLVTMIIVLNAVGLPIEYIGLILSVDWLLDRFRTTVNVFGDSVGAAAIDSSFPKT